jgi:PAS domain S-box-containing protein
MQIRTRLKLNTWISLSVVTLMLISLGWSFREAHRADQRVSLLHEIEKDVHDRIMLRDDWLLNREDRAIIQWQAKNETIQKLLESAALKLPDAETKDLLDDVRKDFAATSSLFSIVLEKHKLEKSAAKKELAFTEAESRIISQLFLKAYSLNDNLNRLHEYHRKIAIEVRNRGIILIIVFIIAGIIATVINSVSLNVIISKRVTTLADGIQAIGDGKLDYSIAMAGNDELADLARVSNEMTAKLKQSYTSVEDFKREINERKKAEDNIKKLSLHQQALLAAISDIIMEVDTNKIYTWANEPGFIFFGEDVIGKAADFYFVREQITYDVVHPIFDGSEDVIYVESWQRRKDGQERLLAWWCHVLKDAQGNVTGALSSARDITAWKQAETEIKNFNEELEQRIAKRTVELAAKTNELERINKVFVDRELRMRELKARIAELEKKA